MTAVVMAMKSSGDTSQHGTAPVIMHALKIAALAVFSLIAGAAQAAEPTANGDPPLIVATKAGDLAQVNTLLNAGTYVDTPDTEKRTALNWAAYLGGLEIARTLIAHRAQIDIHANPSGWTPLMNAAASGFADVCALLIEQGADINAHSTDGGYTPLMYAARKTRKYVVALLLDHGARVNDLDSISRTALDFADLQTDTSINALLIAHGGVRGSHR